MNTGRSMMSQGSMGSGNSMAISSAGGYSSSDMMQGKGNAKGNPGPGQGMGPSKASGSSGGIEDLQNWLKYESNRKYEDSLSKLNLDIAKIQGKHLVSYSLDDLQNEKKKVKNELKVYDQEFINKFKRAPTRSEKEPMRNLYMYYKRLK